MAPVSSNHFQKEEGRDEYRLTYQWEDFEGKLHSLSFPISKETLREAEDEFGYCMRDLEAHLMGIETQMKETMINHLRDVADELIARTGYPQFFRITSGNPHGFKIRLSAPLPLQTEIRPVFEKIKSEIAEEHVSCLESISQEIKKKMKAYIEQRGLRFMGKKMGINYNFCVERNRPRLRHVLEEMRRDHSTLSLYEFLKLLVAFVQEIRFCPLPVEDGGKHTRGLWVPPKVLVNNLGDCDSKAVTFASLWTNFKKYPILIIRVPDHCLIGLAIPNRGGDSIRINGLRYTLLEVGGPEKLLPGVITPQSLAYLEGGQFQYELIH